ncbi:hypothetical protein predicted by Glimmer/Critica (plasmid) [Sinorhizobium fredii HH103]|uniref:Uncharacterized protein n=1 Tax=Sinorhizobium fredii (strain HH103) TaxID=1117943 RepID=A0A0B7MT63_SINF1|nr:hypothetical protein AB395_00005597 [Sinorhizobium fredii CCBAU 45436]CEO91178.1 hypothetical protein predicted by Glimmer/Critica [Sinorhizobium fredii HH103]
MKLDDAGESFRRQADSAMENTPGSPLTNAVHAGNICDAQSSTRGVQGAHDIPAQQCNFKIALGITLVDEPHQAINKLLFVQCWRAERLEARA